VGRPMIDLRSRLLAAVMSNGLKEDVGNPKSRCNGVTAFDSLQNSVVTLSPPVTPDSSYEITAVTPSHPDSTDPEAQEQNRVDPKENSPGWPYGRALAALRERCPERVEEHRWELAVMDAGSFVTRWGERAATLGWIANDLFGLAVIPERPTPNFQRLSRYDQTGLLWLLQGRKVVALTEKTAAIENPSGAITVYRRHNKPAIGPLGDSLEDFGPRAIKAENASAIEDPEATP
jgi:hypothetical protein